MSAVYLPAMTSHYYFFLGSKSNAKDTPGQQVWFSLPRPPRLSSVADTRHQAHGPCLPYCKGRGASPSKSPVWGGLTREPGPLLTILPGCSV